MSNSPEVSIVLPAHNEAEALPTLLAEVRDAVSALGLAAELLVVDDGSTDETAALVRRASASTAPGAPQVRLLRLARSFGHQGALRAGLEAARGRAVITMDADGQHPPHALAAMIAAWQAGAAVVRMRRNPPDDGASAWFYRLINRLSPTPVPAGVGDFQLLDRAVVAMVCRFQDPAPFLRGVVAWLGHEAVILDYQERPRVVGQASYTFWSRLRLALAATTSLSRRPLRLAFWLSMVTVLGSLIYLLIVLLNVAFGAPVAGWASTNVLILFLGAVQLFCVAILGEYLGEVFERVRGTPPYVLHANPEGVAEPDQMRALSDQSGPARPPSQPPTGV